MASATERPTREVLPVPDPVWRKVHPLCVRPAPRLEALQHFAQHGELS